MRTYPKLPADTINHLLREYLQTRRTELRDRVVEAHLYIAEIIARKFSGRGVDSDDLFQVAALALTRAVDRFDPARGILFSSFATPVMVGEVKNYFRDKSRLIRPPRRASELARIIEAARETLTQALGRAPRVDEIADNTDLSEDDVLTALEFGAMQPVSLDQQNSPEDDELSIAGLLGEEDRGFADFENADQIRRGLSALTPQQRQVIEMRFFENLSQREIAQRIGTSQMTVSRAERSALERLKQALSTEHE